MLTPPERRFLADARRGVLATIDAHGAPRLVPICYVLNPVDAPGGGPVLLSPLDEKPKSVADPRRLARVRDVVERPVVHVLVDRWSEDWTELAWLRLDGRAGLLEPGEPGHAPALVALRRKYPQYVGHRLESRPLLRIVVERARGWSASVG